VVYKGDNECFFGNYPTLEEINNAYHKNMAVSMLMSQLSSLNEFCGCKGKISDEQTEECASMIVLNYPRMKISELALFFMRFKSARYGQFYGGVDPLVIMSALQTFSNERNDAIFQHDKAVREEKEAKDRAKAISWDEYCKRKGLVGKPNPLSVLHG